MLFIHMLTYVRRRVCYRLVKSNGETGGGIPSNLINNIANDDDDEEEAPAIPHRNKTKVVVAVCFVGLRLMKKLIYTIAFNCVLY